MNMMEFTFDDPVQILLDACHAGERLPVSELLARLDGESDESIYEALEGLEAKGVAISLEDLPVFAVDSQTHVRLRREAQLVAEKALPGALEENDPLRLYLEELALLPACGDLPVLADALQEANRKEDPENPVYMQVMNLCLSRVVELAESYAGKGVLMLDLIQEGSMHLWQKLFAYTQGDLEAFRDQAIHSGMVSAVVVQAHAAGVGQKLRQALEDYRGVDEQLLTELGRNPTLEEIAEAMHITPAQAAVVADMVQNARNLNRVKQPEETQDTPEEAEQAVEDTAYFQMRQRIMDLLSNLSEADAKLLTLRYGLEGGAPLTPQQVGAKLGLTPEEVVAREAAALSQLRTK